MTETFNERRARQQRERRERDPEHFRAIQKRSRDKRIATGKNAEQNRRYKIANPERVMWHSAKSRAKRKGFDFNIEVSDIVIPDVCPVLGIPMTSPSLDRKDNRLGYVKGNVFVISTRANNLKSDGTLAELKALVAYLSED